MRVKQITDDLVADLDGLTFRPPVTNVYNPLLYARGEPSMRIVTVLCLLLSVGCEKKDQPTPPAPAPSVCAAEGIAPEAATRSYASTTGDPQPLGAVRWTLQLTGHGHGNTMLWAIAHDGAPVLVQPGSAREYTRRFLGRRGWFRVGGLVRPRRVGSKWVPYLAVQASPEDVNCGPPPAALAGFYPPDVAPKVRARATPEITPGTKWSDDEVEFDLTGDRVISTRLYPRGCKLAGPLLRGGDSVGLDCGVSDMGDPFDARVDDAGRLEMTLHSGRTWTLKPR